MTAINEFMRKACLLVMNAGERWGYAVRNAGCVPNTPEKTLRLSFDFFDWAVAGEHRHHIVTYKDVFAMGGDNKKQLPVILYGKKEITTEFSALRITTGKVIPSQQLTVVFGFGGEGEYKK